MMAPNVYGGGAIVVLTAKAIRRELEPNRTRAGSTGATGTRGMMPKVPSQRLCLRLAPFASALSLGGCDWAVLDPKGPVGDGNATLLVDSVAIMLVIVVPTIVATLVIAWWFRSSNQRAFYLPDWENSGQLELIIWAIPLLTIMLLGGVTWIGAHDLDPAKPLQSKEEPLNVQVVSLDWKWLFIYPDQHVASVNRLVIPAGTPIHFSLTSGSVMTAFFVPQLGSMIYTMNRMRTQLYLSADNPGVFRGLATQIAGDGFADMHFEVEAKSSQDFYAWLAQTRGGGPALTPESYIELSKQSVVPEPFTFQTVSDGLFEKILDQTLPPGPGPVAEADPGPTVATTSQLCVGRRN
jgi:cytochrome o ubiquinol oxidase subunit II